VGKLASEGSRILGGADVLPVDHNPPGSVSQRGIGLEVSLAEPVRHGISEVQAIGKREERRTIVIAMPGHQPISICSASPEFRKMKSDGEDEV
jgi:hypothetical protein